MDWYEAIYLRKSVRKYRKTPVSPELIGNIENCAAMMSGADKRVQCTIRIYDADSAKKNMKNLFNANAPHYMAVFAPEGSYALMCAGVFAEQMVLYMTVKGIGTCYQGACRLKDSEIPEGMQPAIVIAFGYADDQLTRDAKLAKRENLKKLCSFKCPETQDMLSVLSAARLAPSAINRQPWRFTVYDNRIDLYMNSDSILGKSSVTSRVLDMGIAICHIMEAVDHQWKDASLKIISKEERGTETSGWSEKHYRYLISVVIK